MRAFFLTALLLAGCSQPAQPDNKEVDLYAAADRAQGNTTPTASTADAAPANAIEPLALAARYRCMDGNKIAVRFDDKARKATISRGGKPLATLDRQQAESGIWYKSGGYELRGGGDVASLTTPGQPPLACTVIR